MESVWTWGSIIDALGGTGAVAEALGESASTVSGWRKRPRGIPGERWRGLVNFAASSGNADITLDVLAEVAARRVEVDEVEARA
ncbi:carph-isopro domain-containing protein [Bradyrhizobium sp. Pa8]|uniref:carph-isopro domain-containing protein n=1 Tax=Bradyrhizobium sp. Pa8 TaxID=3386552 RepID=UPI00403FB996